MQQWDVRVVCTTDDPADSLEHHIAHAKSGCPNRMLPTWRPDKAMAVQDPASYNAYLDQLGKVADVDIGTLGDLLTALDKRHDFFHAVGCRLSDHGLERCYAADYTEAGVQTIFAKVRGGAQLTAEEVEQFSSFMLYRFAVMDHAKGWTQQFHLGAMRNNNTRLFNALGPDTGFDSIGDYPQGIALSRFLDRLDTTDQLARTILYNLNPNDNELLATMIGNFQDGSVPGKMQFGSGGGSGSMGRHDQAAGSVVKPGAAVALCRYAD